jgi:hypothetical protein
MSLHYRALTTFKLEEEVTSLSESSQGEVGDNREKWGEFCEKLIAINRNIVINFQPSRTCCLKKTPHFHPCYIEGFIYCILLEHFASC